MSRASEQPAAPAHGDAIRVLFCCDPSYHQHLAVALASLLANNPANRLELHLAASRRAPESEARLLRQVAAHGAATLEIHDFDWGEVRWHTSFHITQEAYIRLFAARFLPQVDRILYLDADLLVLGDLRSLWETDLKGCAVAAVPDPYGEGRRAALGLPAAAPYVNSGVLLMDLARWRADDLTGQLARCVEAMGSRLLFHDQDALNAVLQGRLRVLDYRWNLQAKMLRRAFRRRLADEAAIARAARQPAILHYTSSRKPWLFVSAIPAKHLYRRYLRQTEWRGAAPADRRLRRIPEFLANLLMYALGLDYSWERFLRATLPGRAIARLGRATAAIRPAFRGS